MLKILLYIAIFGSCFFNCKYLKENQFQVITNELFIIVMYAIGLTEGLRK